MRTSIWLVTLGICAKLVTSEKLSDYRKVEDLEHSIEPETLAKIQALLGQKDCGISGGKTGRIVGGEPAKLGAWPWIAAIGIQVPVVDTTEFSCGASIISDRWAVSAAHCFSEVRTTDGRGLDDYGITQNYKMLDGGIRWILRVGDLNLDDKVDDGATPQTHLIEKIVSHPNFITKLGFGEDKGYDIALVRTENPITFSDHVRPVCLPYKDIFFTSKDFEGYQPFVAGWGHTKEKGKQSNALLQAQIPIISTEECTELFMKAATRKLHEDIVCTMAEGKDACQGDSGGPLVLPIEDRYYLYGVVSYGIGCARKNSPGFYNKVHTHLKWITNVISTA